MEQNNIIAALLISVSIILGMMVLGISIRNGLGRSAAINSGMSALDYSHWMDDVR